MSLPTEIADGPHGPEPIISISRGTLTWAAVAVLAIIMSLMTVIWVGRGIYLDTRKDLETSRAEASCARSINAQSTVASGEYLQQVGEIVKQLGETFRALPPSGGDSSAFFTETAKFEQLDQEADRLKGLYDQALTAQSQVNETCTDIKSGGS
jgi:hypothetical protein